MRRAASTRDETADAFGTELFHPFGERVGRAMRREYLGFVRHGKNGELLCRLAHHLPVAGASHDDPDNRRAASHSYPPNCCPVRRRRASRYFSEVFAITSAGSRGAGGVLFQSRGSRESRTYCLANDRGVQTGWY